MNPRGSEMCLSNFRLKTLTKGCVDSRGSEVRLMKNPTNDVENLNNKAICYDL